MLTSTKRIFLLLLLILITFSSVQIASAIGMRGVMRTTVMFKPGEHYEFTYEVISNMPTNKDIELYVKKPAELNDVEVKLSANSIPSLPSGASEFFDVTIDFPSNLSFYGPKDIRVGAVEEMPQLRRSAIGSRSAVEAVLTVWSPYPGKYVIGQFDVPKVKINEPVYMNLVLRNYGQEGIASVAATVDIFDEDKNKLASVKAYTPSNKNQFEVSLDPEQSKEMYVDWTPAEGTSGVYLAIADITFDGQKTTAEGKILIGDLALEVVNLTGSVPRGTITELVARVESLWNMDVFDVFVDIFVLDPAGTRIAQTRSIRDNVGAWAGHEFKAYLNTQDIAAGKYKANVTVYYEGKESSSIFDLEVREEVRQEAPAPVAVEPGMNWTLVLIIVVVLLVFGQIIFFFLIKRDKKKKKGKGKRR